MPERSALTQVVQLGVESSPGTAVAATKRLGSMSIDPTVNAEVSTYAPTGSKYDTLVVHHREYATHSISGIPTYDEIIYPLAGVFGDPVTTTPQGATTARLHTFSLSLTAADTVKTFTMEKGDGTTCDDYAGLLFNALGIDVSATDVTLNGGAISKAVVTGQTLATNTTALALNPIARKHASVYLDESFATLGTTKLTRSFAAGFALNDRHNPVFPVDAALGGTYAATVESKPSFTATITLAKDTNGDALVTLLRSSATRYMRIEFIGPVIEDAITYRMTIDLPVKVNNVESLYEDADGIHAARFGLAVVSDGTRTGKIEVVNALTGL